MFAVTVLFILPSMTTAGVEYTGYALNVENNIITPKEMTSELKGRFGELDTIVESIPLKETNGSWFKPYMDYRKITDKTSKQYKFINQDNVSVNDKGMLMLDEEFYCVALGYYFGDIGTKYIITFETGQMIKVVKAESKNPSSHR